MLTDIITLHCFLYFTAFCIAIIAVLHRQQFHWYCSESGSDLVSISLAFTVMMKFYESTS